MTISFLYHIYIGPVLLLYVINRYFVIQGNKRTLFYVADMSLRPTLPNLMEVQFVPGKWYKKVNFIPQVDRPVQGVDPATREDLMMALQSIEFLLIR